MTRHIRRKGKSAYTKAAAAKRAAQEQVAPPAADKRPRHELAEGSDDDDAPMFETDLGYVGDDDDSDVLSPRQPSEPPHGAHDFDEADLAQDLINAANEQVDVVVTDELGDERFAEEDGPTLEEQLELADYQLVEESDHHDDEASGLFDHDSDSDSSDLPSPSSLPQTPPRQPTPIDSAQTPAEETGAEASGGDVMIVATHATTAAGVEPSDPYSGSQPISQPRRDWDLDDFNMALGIFCIDNAISRPQYTALKEILQLLKKGDGLSKLDRLPETVDTLKSHVREELPHIQVRSKEVVLNPKKLSSSRQIAALASDKDKPVQDLFFMNPVDMFGRVLSSTLANSMHFGLAQLVDNPTEAWHSLQWAGMVRTTSGDLPFYPEATAAPADDGQRDPIFPGDVISFKCGYVACTSCRGNRPTLHTGQVFGIYRDNRQSRLLGEAGVVNPKHQVDTVPANAIVLLVARIFNGQALLRIQKKRKVEIRVNPVDPKDLSPGEQVLVIEPLEYVDPNMVAHRVDLPFDYGLGSSVSFSDDPQPTAARPYIRRAYHTKESAILPMCKVTPVPGVLEVNQFGRNELIKKFARGSNVRSMPIYSFIDGFGLYRTMRKSVMGVYMQSVAMPKAEHTRQANVFPLTLGPHASNFEDVAKAVAPMRFLESGMSTVINGQETTVCTPVLALTGDMVQQNQNSGCLSVAANIGCRSCTVPSAERGNLEYDVVDNQRSHYEVTRQRRALDEQAAKTKKDAFSSKHGVSVDKPAVLHIAPALDLIAGRPGDTAHSEFGGITKMTHQLLLDVALKPKAATEYAKVLRRMPFPPGWGQIQSPFHVLSYTLSEHARWALLMVVISLYWLKEDHLKAPFVRAMKNVFKHEIESEGKSVPNVLTTILARLVKSNSLLSAPQLDPADRNPETFKAVILTSRRLFQRLCQAAALTAGVAHGAAAQKALTRIGSMPPPSRPGSPSVGPSSRTAALAYRTRSKSVASAADEEVVEESIEVLPSVEEELAEDINLGQLTSAQKAVKYNQWAARPNVHAGLHYYEDLVRYGLPSLQMVLPGEMKHKKWKALVLHSNHRNPEKDSLVHEDLTQTIRLILHDGFLHDEPTITAKIKQLSTAVPSVFKSLLPRDADFEDADNGAITLRTVGDVTHVEPNAFVRLQAKAAKAQHLPTREGDMSAAFNTMLSRAYNADYAKTITMMGNRPISWWKKLGFAKSLAHGQRRSVFARGQYVTIRNGMPARLDQIFTHEAMARSGVSYIFLVVTPINETDRTEPLTELPILQPRSGADILDRNQVDVDAASQLIIGLPALGSDKLYMVPYSPADQVMITTDMDIPVESELLHVNWRTHFHG